MQFQENKIAVQVQSFDFGQIKKPVSNQLQLVFLRPVFSQINHTFPLLITKAQDIAFHVTDPMLECLTWVKSLHLKLILLFYISTNYVFDHCGGRRYQCLTSP